MLLMNYESRHLTFQKCQMIKLVMKFRQKFRQK